MDNVDCVLRWEALLGEVPVWSARDRLLYWLDIRALALHGLDLATGSNRSWSMPVPIGAVAIHGQGGLLVALVSGLSHFDPATGALVPVQRIEVEIATSRPNDGRCDRQGRFWVGSMNRATPDGRGVSPTARCTGCSATSRCRPAWRSAPTGRRCISAISPTRRLMAYAIDPTTAALGPPGCSPKARRPAIRMAR